MISPRKTAAILAAVGAASLIAAGVANADDFTHHRSYCNDLRYASHFHGHHHSYARKGGCTRNGSHRGEGGGFISGFYDGSDN